VGATMWTFLQRVCLGAVLLLAAPAALCSPADDFQRLSDAAASKALRAAERWQVLQAIRADPQLMEQCWQRLETATRDSAGDDLRLALAVLGYWRHPRTLAAMRKHARALPSDNYFQGNVASCLHECAGERFEAQQPANFESLPRAERIAMWADWFDKGGEPEFEPGAEEKWKEVEKLLQGLERSARGEDKKFAPDDFIEAFAHALLPLTHESTTLAIGDRLIGAMQRLVSISCDDCDGSISYAQRIFLDVVQNNFGVHDLQEDADPRRRDVIEPVARQVITEWNAFRKERAEGNEGDLLVVWRMRRLHARGYGTNTASERVVQELLRAIRAGSTDEAKTASDVTQQLGLSTSIVPIGEANTVSDALLRGIVVEQVVDSLVAGKRVVWDDVEKRWRVEMGADRWP
jgi:hypothetical protein